MIIKRLIIRAVISYTTRKKRKSETQGVEHYFLNKFTYLLIKLKILLHLDHMVAYTEINDNKYFATLNELKQSNLYIIDPDGYDSLIRNEYIRKNHIRIMPIYIYCSEQIRCDRYTSRSSEATYMEFKKRNESENDQFERFERIHKEHFKGTFKYPEKELIAKIDNSSDINTSVGKLITLIKSLAPYYDLFCIIGRTGSGKDTLVTRCKDYFDMFSYSYYDERDKS